MPSQSDHALEELQAFVSVVEANGFRAAARSTQGRKATLSKRVQDLEARLGVSLLVRTTRALRLTDEGRAYFERAALALAAARDAEAAVVATRAEPRGLLRVTVASSFAPSVLDVVTAYLSRYAAVRVELVTSERHPDLVREGFDVAVWLGALEDSALVARRLGVSEGGYYASPQYLARRGRPRRPDELAAHDAIVVSRGDPVPEWFFVINGKSKRIPIRGPLVVTDLALASRAAAAGLGIVRAPIPIVRAYVERKELVPVLRDWTPPGVEVHAVFPRGGALVPKTRAFVDMLQDWFHREKRGALRSDKR
jgi:DNA-binding transcriptional LysR family regulator